MSPVLAPASIPTVDSAKAVVGVQPMTPDSEATPASTDSACSHVTLPCSSRIPLRFPTAISVPDPSKNSTNEKETTTIRNSMLSRFDDIPSRKSPSGGAAGEEMNESGISIIPNIRPATAVTAIPMRMPVDTRCATRYTERAIQNTPRSTAGSDMSPSPTSVELFDTMTPAF